jgi:hypothetical protein
LLDVVAIGRKNAGKHPNTEKDLIMAAPW